MTTPAAPAAPVAPTATVATFKPAEFREKIRTGQPTSGLIVLVGDEKSGKTALMASFPDHYILQLDPNGGDYLRGRFDDIKDLTRFQVGDD